MKVLVVESEDWLRHLIVPWLSEAGFQVEMCPGPQQPDLRCAGAGPEGWRGCPLAEDADLIVLDLELESDLMMCGVAAWELLHHYRRLDKPVVVLTGLDDPIKPLPSDRLALLPRPPDRDGLVEAVKVLLLAKDLHPWPEEGAIGEIYEVDAPNAGSVGRPVG